MAHIKITEGLDIPIEGDPSGGNGLRKTSGEIFSLAAPHHIALNLSAFDDMKFKILVRAEESVKLGQPLVEDKDCPGRYFVAPASGAIREIRRGAKRRLLDIVIEASPKEEAVRHPILRLQDISRQELIERLKLAGLFTHIRQRPFNFLANPAKTPDSIFVKALESAPFTPPSELQIEGYEKEFQTGLDALAKLTDGPVHLVYRHGTPCKAFSEAKSVQHHTAEGPHPIANPSVHIARLDPIRHADKVIWTVDARAAVAIGYLLMHGEYFVHRVISIAGPGITEGRTGYFRAREGYPISGLLSGSVKKGLVRLISGNPLTGQQVEPEDYLGYEDTVFCIIPEQTKREFMHFFRLGTDKYTFSKTYLSGHVDNSHREYDFTTSQHGEHRPFIDSTLYDEVMPLNVPTMQLVKAIMAEDYDLAAELGLLEVDSEDFALPAFVCPSKIEMIDIVKRGLRRYAADILK